jgi:hypothetical protein
MTSHALSKVSMPGTSGGKRTMVFVHTSAEVYPAEVRGNHYSLG